MARREGEAAGAAAEADGSRRGWLLTAAVVALLVAAGAAISGTWDGIREVPEASTASAENTSVPQDACDPTTKADDRSRFMASQDALRLRRTTEGDAMGYCAPDGAGMRLGRAMVAFARGEADAPAFADRVERWSDGERKPPFSADKAARRGSWSATSAVGELDEIAERVRQGEPAELSSPNPGERRIRSDPNSGLVYIEPSAGPYLSVLDGEGVQAGALSRVSGVRCRAQSYPSALDGREPAVLVIGISTAPSEPDCDFVDVFTDDAGRVDALVLRTGDGGPAPKNGQARG